MSITSYFFPGSKEHVTRGQNSALIAVVDEEHLDSGNQVSNWVPGLWGVKTPSATKLCEESDPERRAWAVLSRRAMSRWLRENS
jgi:hypothetical protein